MNIPQHPPEQQQQLCVDNYYWLIAQAGKQAKKRHSLAFICCSELVDYTRSYLQTDKFGLHFGLDYDM